MTTKIDFKINTSKTFECTVLQQKVLCFEYGGRTFRGKESDVKNSNPESLGSNICAKKMNRYYTKIDIFTSKNIKTNYYLLKLASKSLSRKKNPMK